MNRVVHDIFEISLRFVSVARGNLTVDLIRIMRTQTTEQRARADQFDLDCPWYR